MYQNIHRFYNYLIVPDILYIICNNATFDPKKRDFKRLMKYFILHVYKLLTCATEHESSSESGVSIDAQIS